MTILGRYLSKMKLNQYNMYKWEDTEKIKAKAEAEKKAKAKAAKANDDK